MEATIMAVMDMETQATEAMVTQIHPTEVLVMEIQARAMETTTTAIMQEGMATTTHPIPRTVILGKERGHRVSGRDVLIPR